MNFASSSKFYLKALISLTSFLKNVISFTVIVSSGGFVIRVGILQKQTNISKGSRESNAIFNQ